MLCSSCRSPGLWSCLTVPWLLLRLLWLVVMVVIGRGSGRLSLGRGDVAVASALYLMVVGC
jgi:hypothetical protein